MIAFLYGSYRDVPLDGDEWNTRKQASKTNAISQTERDFTAFFLVVCTAQRDDQADLEGRLAGLPCTATRCLLLRQN